MLGAACGRVKPRSARYLPPAYGSGYPRCVCRVCMKRPEIPDERYGRCEQCAKAGRNAFRFRLFPARGGTGFTVKAGELSPHALRQKWRAPLAAYKGHLSTKTNLGLHELEMITAKERVESLRVAPDLAGHATEVLAALPP